MAPIKWTSQQRQAIDTTRCSILVTAAAGAGKTAVLAERCAYLVCDAPPGQRCNVDQLLVLTFTNAAAAEMRSRIVEAIRGRLAARPGDVRLYQQVALVDAAQISTIHSFCLWMIRRWFSEVEIDPNVAVLDEEEAALLRREVLDELFRGLYDQDFQSADGTGFAASMPLADRFKDLVDQYGLGDDRTIAALILQLHAFTCSLPNPQGWLRNAWVSLSTRPDREVAALYEELREELGRQADHCEQTAALIESGGAAGHFYGNEVRSYAEQLRAWSGQCPMRDAGEGSDNGLREYLAVFETIRQQIASYAFSKKQGPRLSKDSNPAALKARDSARNFLQHVKDKLFQQRLRSRYTLFSAGEWIEGLQLTAPFVTTIAELVTEFDRAFQARKRQLDVLGFADLERLAFGLLSTDSDPPAPSEVARSLQRRFAYVLVDEFQDINPVQRSIIELVSREHNPDLEDNLFVVGDVKQSIYRFRLAEPEIFMERLRHALRGAPSPTAIALQTNFRSRAEILVVVNLLFRRLMVGGTGDVVYDDTAELRPGRATDAGPAHVPIELHLLERRFPGEAESGESEDTDEQVPDYLRSHAWSSIEREGYLIGTRIQEWMADERSGPLDRPLAYRDVAVLLRAARVNAERIAVTLNAMGIAAHTGTGGSLFQSLEVRDLLAALKVVDNPQQDIPLAAVLRSGMMGERFNEDELVEMRCHVRGTPFHESVRAFAESAGGHSLRRRLHVVFQRIAHYRNEFRLRPLADALWDLYERQGFLAHVSGLPNGTQRRANLIKIHEMARRFATFRRQGLSRFLLFVASLEEEGREIATAPPSGQSEDVVRVMTIHQAKGLEFPVVFVAGLGSQFNLGDRKGRMIYERRAGIGLRVVDTHRMIEYPTAAHLRAVGRIEQVTREEELRVLYVALTRARDKLVLVASAPNVVRFRGGAHEEAGGSVGGPNPGPSRLAIAMAATPLDWLLPAIASAPADQVCWPDRPAPPRPIVEVHLHTPKDMGRWTTDRHLPHDDELRSAVAEGRPLPTGEPFASDDHVVEQVRARIDYVYPHLAGATLPAVMAASEFRREDEEAAVWKPQSSASRTASFRIIRPGAEVGGDNGAVARGLLTHTVLQHLDFRVAVDSAGLAAELSRMAAASLIPQESLDMLDVASLEWFVATPLARILGDAGDEYHREFQFVTKEPTSYVDPTTKAIANANSPNDFQAGDVLIRGVVDGILSSDRSLELIDFKTDRVREDEVSQRSQHYRLQMELYARAMTRIWRRPVVACRLVFLSARQIVELADLRSNSLKAR